MSRNEYVRLEFKKKKNLKIGGVIFSSSQGGGNPTRGEKGNQEVMEELDSTARLHEPRAPVLCSVQH